MNARSFRLGQKSVKPNWFLYNSAKCLALAIICTGISRLHAQTDTFDSGSDAAWSKITNPNYPATYSFPTDSFGGKAYRLQGAAPSGTLGGTNTARVAAYRADRLYTNFYVAADIVGWDTGYTNDQAFGLLARATNVDSGLLSAATFSVRPNRFPDSGGSRGQSYIYSFYLGEIGAPGAGSECTLIPGHKYRLVFSGVSNLLTGALYDLEDLTRPLLSMTGDDAAAANPFLNPNGAPFPDPNGGGYSGIFNFSLGGSDPRTDTTFDNFVASESPPTSVASPATPHGMPGAPQVVNRSPASFSNFCLAPNGISFHATTLTTTNAINTNAIKLFLNGLDVSSGLSITGPTTNAAVSYNGLTSNAVYNARIELQDSFGRKTTNVWTFDTFSDAYLALARCKNIECEDFDYSSDVNNVFIGNCSFIDNPLPSGYATNDPNHTTPINQSDPVNNVFKGYLDLRGAAGIDFFDYDGAPKSGENDFRFYNPVGTTLGTFTHQYSDGNDPNVVVNAHSFDTQRQKYFNENPALNEYVVERTEGGEWLNYTRIFSPSNYYNVYLRYNSALPVVFLLDQIGAGPTTNNLGGFATQPSSVLGNYRYTALTNGSGRLAVVNLSGTNTLRETQAPPQAGSLKQRTALNYLAFVPALLVESGPLVTGPYAIETGASVEPGTRRITVPTNGSTRFYRLRWDHAVTIKSVSVSGSNVLLTYQ